MLCRLAWIAVFAGLLLSSHFAVAQTAEQWLELAQREQHRQSYQGSFVYERADIFATHKVWRLVTDSEQYQERFLRLNGPRFEVLRVNGRVDCMSPSAIPVPAVVEALRQHTYDMAHIRQGYRVEHLGQSRVADRLTEVVLFRPRDVHRYPFELHLDQQTGVPLKSLLLTERGELLERFQYVEFSTAGVMPEHFQVDSERCVATPPTKSGVADSTRAIPWQLEWLPVGYTELQQPPQYWNIDQQPISSQVFTDGVTHFSVFVEALNDQQVEVDYRQFGPTTVVTRPLETNSGRFLVTLLGEIPMATAERIALSVRLTPTEAQHD